MEDAATRWTLSPRGRSLSCAPAAWREKGRSMYQEKTLLEALTFLIQNWDKIFIQTHQSGRLRTCSLVEVEDQKALLKFVTNWLETWGRVNGHYGRQRRALQSGESGVPVLSPEE